MALKKKQNRMKIKFKYSRTAIEIEVRREGINYGSIIFSWCEKVPRPASAICDKVYRALCMSTIYHRYLFFPLFFYHFPTGCLSLLLQIYQSVLIMRATCSPSNVCYYRSRIDEWVGRGRSSFLDPNRPFLFLI